MDARKLLFPDGVFDIVFFPANGLDCLYPMENRMKALREMGRILKPDGLLVYSSHNSINVPRTKAGLKITLQNLKKLRIGPHWRDEHHPYGDFTIYYNNIWNEHRKTETVGFKLISILANRMSSEKSKLFIAFLEKHPMYVFRKNKRLGA